MHSLPLLDSAFGPLHHAQIFSRLDLPNVGNLVRICEGDEWKTTFNTLLGRFEYLVMRFGLTKAPTVFQALVSNVIRDILNWFVFVDIDDILISFEMEEKHIQHVCLVFSHLLETGCLSRQRDVISLFFVLLLGVPVSCVRGTACA